MTTDNAMDRLKVARDASESLRVDRENYAAYVTDRLESGWSESDAADYRAEVGRIMTHGTIDEKRAASEFWSASRIPLGPALGINYRMRESLAESK